MKFDCIRLEEPNPYGRLYLCEGKYKYPSVTTVIGSQEEKPYLKEWKERVGEVEAARISKLATTHGTALHKMAEDFLTDTLDVTQFNPFTRNVFRKHLPLLKRITNVKLLEGLMYSNNLKVAGTVDCIADFDGIPSIIDFKTTKTMKNKEDITDYFIQTSLYSYMWYERSGLTNYKNLVIIFFCDDLIPVYYSDSLKNYLPKAVKLMKDYYDKYPDFSCGA